QPEKSASHRECAGIGRRRGRPEDQAGPERAEGAPEHHQHHRRHDALEARFAGAGIGGHKAFVTYIADTNNNTAAISILSHFARARSPNHNPAREPKNVPSTAAAASGAT